MAGALNLLLTGCLLQGVLCQVFEVSILKSIKALSGSCVTIPCSFDIEKLSKKDLDKTCRAIWKRKSNDQDVFNSAEQTKINGELKGTLTEKDCTTTLSNIVPDTSNTYYFRLECNKLKYNFNKANQMVDILFKADPPSPTLTPSTLEVTEGTSVRLKCSAPAPCLSQPPTLTWTPRLGDSQETLQENQDKTKVVTSVLTFTASHLHHGKTISCAATYNKQDGTKSTANTSLTADISFAPQILSTSGCTKTEAELNCFCETVGNPTPILQWHSDELNLNQSDKYEDLNDTTLRSFITVSQVFERDAFTFLCHSTNSLGSVTQWFYVFSLVREESAECSDEVTLQILIITVGVLTAALVSAVLFAIRAQRTGCHNPTKRQYTDDTSTTMMSQGLTSERENEASITPEDIYVNTDTMIMSDKPNTQLRHPHKSEDDSDVIYSSVIWKSKTKKARGRSGNRNPSGSYALEMESVYDNITPRRLEDVREEVCTVYDQVNF